MTAPHHHHHHHHSHQHEQQQQQQHQHDNIKSSADLDIVLRKLLREKDIVCYTSSSSSRNDKLILMFTHPAPR